MSARFRYNEGMTTTVSESSIDFSDLDQRALAKKCGVHESQVSRILHGKQNPTLRTAATMAAALGITLDELSAKLDEVKTAA